MATSGELLTNDWQGTHGNRYLEFGWYRISYDAAAQTTTIGWNLISRGTYSGYVMSAPFSVVIDGSEEYYSEYRIKLYPDQYIATGQKTIKHNADGTKNFTVSVRAAIYKGSINCTGSKTFTLNPVGAATITTAPSFNDEENPTITYNNPVGDAIGRLSAAISLTGENPDIDYRDIDINGSSYTFTLTEAERDLLRAATVGSNSRKIRFYLRSVIEDRFLFSWKEANYTVINAAPTVSGSVVDTNSDTIALTGDNKTLIRGYSTAQATRTAAAYKQATITNEYTEHSGSTTTDYNKLYLNVDSNVFTFAATDSRNNAVNTTVVAPMIDYIKPTANIDSSAQMDAEGNYTLKVGGNYYNDTFGFTDAAAANTITVSYRYKEQGGNYGGWKSISKTLNGNTYSAEYTISGLDYRKTYVLQCSITDKLNTVYSAELTVRSLPVFHWGENDFTFEVPVSVNSDLTIAGDLFVNGENFGNVISYGEWVPVLSNNIVVRAYNVQQGWYSKVGNVVNIGWQLKATIKNGYPDVVVALDGCPFQPAYSAFGGGVAHNIVFNGGFNFEGYAIGTDGRITLRGQPCNNTAAINLQITSSAYCPIGDNDEVITLAGSLCFIVNE